MEVRDPPTRVIMCLDLRSAFDIVPLRRRFCAARVPPTCRPLAGQVPLTRSCAAQTPLMCIAAHMVSKCRSCTLKCRSRASYVTLFPILHMFEVLSMHRPANFDRFEPTAAQSCPEGAGFGQKQPGQDWQTNGQVWQYVADIGRFRPGSGYIHLATMNRIWLAPNKATMPHVCLGKTMDVAKHKQNIGRGHLSGAGCRRYTGGM